MGHDGGKVLPKQALDRLEEVSGTLATVAARIETVAKASRRTRQLAIALAASFVLDVALTIAVTLLSISALGQTSTLHKSELAACTISNETRTEQVTLWGYIVTLSKNAHTDQAQLHTFEAFVAKTFAPENCARLYG
jgi:hypothetical protein